jgi:hypothetical protein
VLWSAPLPASDNGGSAPWQKVLVLDGPTPGQPTLLMGGHQSGSCFRGHCAPSHSAVAAIQAPAGVDPPPIPPPPPAPGPPAPPSKCQTSLMATCDTARATSADKCEVCCGMNAPALQKAGCSEADFEAFCHDATCNPKADPPQICAKSGVTCPQCGEARCNCPVVPPPPPPPLQ